MKESKWANTFTGQLNILAYYFLLLLHSQKRGLLGTPTALEFWSVGERKLCSLLTGNLQLFDGD